MAAGSTGEKFFQASPHFQREEDNRNVCFGFKAGPVHHLGNHYYSPTRGPKEDRSWGPHVDGYQLLVRVFQAVHNQCL